MVKRTHLDGVFDLLLQWTPDPQLGLRPDQVAPQDGGPSIFTALQERLGLRLEAAKGPVAVFVIDHAEPPAEN